jgi:pyridoxal phosphate enzyme (YggS family)
VELFSLIHSIDSTDLAREVGKRALAMGKVQEVLVEVNTSGEEQKFGVEPARAIEALQEIDELPGIKVLGLMTVGPLADDAGKVRDAFRTLRSLFDQAGKLKFATVQMRHLSMGMSGDFELAIAEGATMVRIGSAIFGSRT